MRGFRSFRSFRTGQAVATLLALGMVAFAPPSASEALVGAWVAGPAFPRGGESGQRACESVWTFTADRAVAVREGPAE
jgi:hypothetical protein